MPRLECVEKEEEAKDERKEKEAKGADSCRATRERDRPTDRPLFPGRKCLEEHNRFYFIFWGGAENAWHCTEIREVGFPDQSVLFFFS
jgi:hypothetical protein